MVRNKLFYNSRLPGGLVDPPEDFITAGVRETIEEAGIHVEIKGILRVEQSIKKNNYQRLKVIFYAEPIDENEIPKQKPDKGDRFIYFI